MVIESSPECSRREDGGVRGRPICDQEASPRYQQDPRGRSLLPMAAAVAATMVKSVRHIQHPVSEQRIPSRKVRDFAASTKRKARPGSTSAGLRFHGSSSERRGADSGAVCSKSGEPSSQQGPLPS